MNKNLIMMPSEMDTYGIDTHKLMYHPRRVADWLEERDIYPLYIEISPYGGCNYRCIFCALDYLKYKPAYLNPEILKGFLQEISMKGVKSIMFAGEGEPLLHKDISGLVIYAKDCGLDVAITTNGALLSISLSEKLIPELSWLRISFNAGTDKTYSFIHKTTPKDFDRVIENIKEAIKIKKNRGYSCIIGAQVLLLSENYGEVALLADIMKDIGSDYLIVKPYSQHPLSVNHLKFRINYKKLLYLEEELKTHTTKDFRIIFRKKTMSKIGRQKSYEKCSGLPFWAYLTSNGDLYACSAFLGNKDFCYGNIYKDSFGKIWKGRRRRKVIKMMENDWNIEDCREVCRLDEINRFLWDLKHPPEHVNFI